VLDDLELGDGRRVERERALDTHAEGDLAHGERFAEPTARAPDHHALEDLHALPVAFDDAGMNLDGVTRSELRKPFAQVRLLDEIGGVHGGRARIPASPLRPA
jgi:hypothetical protein